MSKVTIKVVPWLSRTGEIDPEGDPVWEPATDEWGVTVDLPGKTDWVGEPHSLHATSLGTASLDEAIEYANWLASFFKEAEVIVVRRPRS